mmetsp:Transcript_97679/g.314712  ORF Transcript_97679/g.314712 Transcript_97679/m.314712 type:complete len:84 (+) Transcript_97679:224-475(+)
MAQSFAQKSREKLSEMDQSFAQSLAAAPAPVPALTDSMNLMFCEVKNFAAERPETRPKTTQSNKELPPRRLLPWMPPAASPEP